MLISAGLFFLVGKLAVVTAMLLVFGLSRFDDEIPSELLASLPVEREPMGDPIDANYQRLPL